MDNQYVINRARELIAQHEQYRMTPTEAQAYLDADHSVGVWAGSPEGEQMRSHINNMTMCARYILSTLAGELDCDSRRERD